MKLLPLLLLCSCAGTTGDLVPDWIEVSAFYGQGSSDGSISSGRGPLYLNEDSDYEGGALGLTIGWGLNKPNADYYSRAFGRALRELKLPVPEVVVVPPAPVAPVVQPPVHAHDDEEELLSPQEMLGYGSLLLGAAITAWLKRVALGGMIQKMRPGDD